MAITKERFAEGLTLAQYIGQMSMNRDALVRAIDAAAIRPEDTPMLDRLAGTTRVLVITEDWCGTSLAYLPFVAKLVESRPDIELRVFLRDENSDVMDQFLKKGMYRSIPVFVFFDEHMNELARFIEQRPS